MLTMAGQANAAQAAKSILEFETEIAKIPMENVENRNPVKTYNKVEITKLNELLANFDWNAYLTAMGTAGKIDYGRSPT